MTTLIHQTLASAVDQPDGPEMRALCQNLYKSGVQTAATAAIRDAAANLRLGVSMHTPLGWFLGRLEGAGSHPVYSDYVAGDILGPADVGTAGAVSATALHTIALIHDHLLGLVALEDHSHFPQIVKAVRRTSEACRRLAFAAGPVQAIPERLAWLSLLPESDVPDELLFLRVTQSDEIIFRTSRILLARAQTALSLGSPEEAVAPLKWSRDLWKIAATPILGGLVPMTIEAWLRFRPIIIHPSAIQSQSFHNARSLMVAHRASIQAAQRIVYHPRQSVDAGIVATCDQLVGEVLVAFDSWYKAHGNIVRKYQPKHEVHQAESASMRYLASQPRLSLSLLKEKGNEVHEYR